MSSMDDTRYRIVLTGEGLTVDREVDQPTALAILNIVLRDGAGALAPDLHPGPPVTPAGAELRGESGVATGGGLSVGEFIAQSSAKRNPDKIVSIGEYLTRQGRSEFTIADIRPMFQQAGEPMPGNFMRDWRWTLAAKWIAPVAGNDKVFYVTNTGRQAVDGGFSAEIRKRTVHSPPRTRKKSGTTE